MSYKKLSFWERSVNPITGWKVEKTDSYTGSQKLAQERRIMNSLESYNNKNNR